MKLNKETLKDKRIEGRLFKGIFYSEEDVEQAIKEILAEIDEHRPFTKSMLKEEIKQIIKQETGFGDFKK